MAKTVISHDPRERNVLFTTVVRAVARSSRARAIARAQAWRTMTVVLLKGSCLIARAHAPYPPPAVRHRSGRPASTKRCQLLAGPCDATSRSVSTSSAPRFGLPALSADPEPCTKFLIFWDFPKIGNQIVVANTSFWDSSTEIGNRIPNFGIRGSIFVFGGRRRIIIRASEN
jgi:hypothetical protein